MDGVQQPLARNLRADIDIFGNARNISECWAYLCAQMADYGFGRLLYARKPFANKSNFHNLTETIVLSTYGPQIDALFVQGRGYTDDLTTQWSLENNGAVSWQVSRTAFLNGDLSPAAEQVHLYTRELGLIAGITFSGPVPRDSVQSGFGLCHDSDDQAQTDEIWSSYEPDLMGLLKLFELCVSRFPHIPEHQKLNAREVGILRLIAEGKTTTDIADVMGVHRRTVENGLTSSRTKLAVPNTASAVYVAITQGQI